MDNNHIKESLDNTLSLLQMQSLNASKLLAEAKGGKKVKRKLSVVMILAIMLLILTVTAIAATLMWEKYVVDLKKREQNQGQYADWEIKTKQDLIKSLMEMGYVQESDLTRQLFDSTISREKQEGIADEIMLMLTKQTDAKEINADIITYAIYGPESTWTAEQRVWWQQVTNMFRKVKDNPDTLVLSEKGDLSEERAISIAKETILKAYELPKEMLDKARPVANLYVTKERPDYRRWDIQFQIYEDGKPDYLQRVYTAVVDMSGKVIADPDVGIDLPQGFVQPTGVTRGRPTSLLFQTIDALALQANERPFRVWPLELKAEYSEKVAPAVQDIIESGDLTPLVNGNGPDLSVIASSMFTYGLPNEKDMAQSDAMELAVQTLIQSYSLDSEAIAMYDDISVYYDITDPDLPLWKFLFTANIASDLFHTRYKVEMNSQTGVITKTDVIEFRKALDQDLEYVLRLY